ncbi:ComEC/Rec2 family competence protein [Candidatus Fermentibacteria bacterium]|nr:ComEC/Rec2 family competence protein [Candidatus Fermentibacteria bacterium]
MVRRPAFSAFLLVAGAMVATRVPFPWWLLLAAGAVLILPLLPWQRKDKMLAVALSAAGIMMQLSTRGTERVARSLLQTDGSVRGVVASLPRRSDRSVTADLSLLDSRGQNSRLRLRVSIPDTTLRLGRGDTLSASGSVRPLEPPANPGETDWSRLLRQRGIIGRLRVRQLGDVLPNAKSPSARDAARSHVEATLSTRAAGEEGALALAMLIGIRDLLDQETMARFRNSGIVHILSISGFHVGIVAALIWAVGRVLLPGFRYPALVALIGVAGYVGLVGLFAPVMRAGVMSVVVLLGLMLGRRAEGINSLGLAGLVLLIAQPRWIWEPGFQLSFGATLGILVFTPPLLAPFCRWRRVARWCIGSVLTSLSAQLGVLPLLLAWFRQWPTYSLLANIPAVILATVLIAASAVTSLAQLVWADLAAWSGRLTECTARILLWLAAFVSKLPFSVLNFGDVRLWALTVAWGAAVGARVGWQWGRPAASAMVGASCMVAAWLVWGTLDPWQAKVERISFLHVPLGNCVAIEAAGAFGVIDPGAVGQPEWAARVVNDHLRFRCIDHVDLVAATSGRPARHGSVDTLVHDHSAARVVLPAAGMDRNWTDHVESWFGDRPVELARGFRLTPLGGGADRLDGLLINSAGGLRVLIAGDGGWQADAQCATHAAVESTDVLYMGPWRDLAPSHLLLRRAKPRLVVIGGGTAGERDLLRDISHAGFHAVATSRGAVTVERSGGTIWWRQNGRS